MSCREEFFFYVIVIIMIGISIKLFIESDAYNLTCIVSTVDGEKYCVRERANLDKSADLLATATGKCKTLVAFMKKKYPVELMDFAYINAKYLAISGDGKMFELKGGSRR